MDDRGEDAERDAKPPDRIVAAELIVEIAAEPDTEERADLMRQETTPPSMPRWRVPNMTATSELVGGTVDSHSRPITMAKTTALVGVCGKSRKAVTATERAR